MLLNDRPDLASDLGCDGVHIGQNDMDYAQARALLGDEAIIGVTCNASRHLAMLAGDAGADYVAFGAFFDTKTKDTSTRPSADILTWWQEVMEPPCVAIGGITPENGDTLPPPERTFWPSPAACGNTPRARLPPCTPLTGFLTPIAERMSKQMANLLFQSTSACYQSANGFEV